MDHYEGITPDQRWRNEMLNEQRETNRILRELLGRNAQAPKDAATVEHVQTLPRRGRPKGAVNQ